jgi:regulator of protease activity HflC (stomatin/prohibitin superfamily)
MGSIWDVLTVGIWGIIGLVVAYKFVRCIRIVPNRTTYILERFGRFQKRLGPGIHVMIPFIDNVAYTRDLREESIEVPPQECFTKDNVKVEVDGVLYISIEDPKAACYGVTNYRYAAMQLAQTTTRSVIGTLELDRTFEEREVINSRVVSVLNEVADNWGIKIHRYEIKNIVPPSSVRESMEQQMSAERERRAILAKSEGEKQSMINESEGIKMELINTAEGEMQKRINEAEGRAEEILSIATATAESIEKVGAAYRVIGGAEAVRLQLAKRALKQFGKLAHSSNKVLLPMDITQMDSLLDGIGLDLKSAQTTAASLRTQFGDAPSPVPSSIVSKTARVPALTKTVASRVPSTILSGAGPEESTEPVRGNPSE